MRAEISYDLVMEDETSFVEGTFRLPGGEWQVLIVSRSDRVTKPEWRASSWESGVYGVVIKFPRDRPLNKGVVEAVLSEVLGVAEWVEVRGPDSMALR